MGTNLDVTYECEYDSKGRIRHESLRYYEFYHWRRRLKKLDIARRLGVRPSRYSQLRDPERYRPTPTDAEVSAIAKLLNRPASYVRRLYSLPVACTKGKASHDHN